MLKNKLSFSLSCYLLPLCWANVNALPPPIKQTKPPLLLAMSFQPTTQIDRFLVSEKLDGVRAFWDGKSLITRGGHVIQCPEWFTANFPNETLDGELWIERGKFEMLSGLIRQKEPDEERWKKVKFMVFDMPYNLAQFDRRYTSLKKLINNNKSPYISVIEQISFNTKAELDDHLVTIIAKGGEGLMLHRKSSLYQAKRSDDLQKLKPIHDAEAVVIRYIPGKGKYKGLLGAIEVINEEGVRFKIGSGFNLQERKNPPPLNSTITYRYRGKTKNNVPRFATFLRQRDFD